MNLDFCELLLDDETGKKETGHSYFANTSPTSTVSKAKMEPSIIRGKDCRANHVYIVVFYYRRMALVL